MTPELEDAVSRFDVCSRGLLEAFLDLWDALRELAERSPGSVLVPQVTVERVPGGSSLDSALRFVAGVAELLRQIEYLEDRNVVAAKASVRRQAHGLCGALADIERLVGRERL